MALILHGYRYSVYQRIARLTLAEKGVAYEQTEVNPFAPDVPAAYLALHPFGRVPALVHDGFALYETAAITRYIDRTFPGAALQPAEPRALARMDQIIGVVDAYAYWPLVRQVFSHRVFRRRQARPATRPRWRRDSRPP
jgi:glutathione S-transferase